MSKEAARTEGRDREQRICFGKTFQLPAERQQILEDHPCSMSWKLCMPLFPLRSGVGGWGVGVVFESMYVRSLELFWN